MKIMMPLLQSKPIIIICSVVLLGFFFLVYKPLSSVEKRIEETEEIALDTQATLVKENISDNKEDEQKLEATDTTEADVVTQNEEAILDENMIITLDRVKKVQAECGELCDTSRTPVESEFIGFIQSKVFLNVLEKGIMA